ncbi:MAG: VTT domain-containing protein [Gemmataceae bacterium]
MDKPQRRTSARLFAWSLLVLVVLCGAARAQTEGTIEVPQADKPSFFLQILQNLFNSRGLLQILSQPEFTLAAFIALNVIVFVETGLLIGFFLPGDSLLVTAGVVAHLADWNLPLLLGTLSVSAIVGDSVGYMIGYKTGPRIFNREKSWFFKKDHLVKAQAFYEKHGGKTIILARFVPIVRTFAPVVAGVAKMNYRRFVSFNVIGGIGWVFSMVLVGFFLTTMINPMFRTLLGNPEFDVKDHIEKVVILVVVLSVMPMFIAWARARWGKKPEAAPQPTEPELVGGVER